MVHWIYILKDDNNNYYVGETTRLYTRHNQHANKLGGVNTAQMANPKVCAIYRANRIFRFLQYNSYVMDNILDVYDNYFTQMSENFDNETAEKNDVLYAENCVTEWLATYVGPENVRGGKYVYNVNYNSRNMPTRKLPICKCGLPCDVRLHHDICTTNKYKKPSVHFVCPTLNMWRDARTVFSFQNKACDYRVEYNDISYRQLSAQRAMDIIALTPRSAWLTRLEPANKCIGCHLRGSKLLSKCIKYNHVDVPICYDCFVDKHSELTKQFTAKDNTQRIESLSGRGVVEEKQHHLPYIHNYANNHINNHTNKKHDYVSVDVGLEGRGVVEEKPYSVTTSNYVNEKYENNQTSNDWCVVEDCKKNEKTTFDDALSQFIQSSTNLITALFNGS